MHWLSGGATRRHLHPATQRCQRENLHISLVLVHFAVLPNVADAHLSDCYNFLAAHASLPAEVTIQVSYC